MSDSNIPQDCKKALSDGYTDLSLFPKWVWTFEVKPNELNKCVDEVSLKSDDGFKLEYCREGYFSVVEEDNQYMVVVRRVTKAIVRKDTMGQRHVTYKHDFTCMAVLPRFMGIVRDRMSDILFYIEDGTLREAWSIAKLTPYDIALVFSMHFRKPFFVAGNTEFTTLLIRAIPRYGIAELDEDVRRELIEQLRKKGVDVFIT
jgi:hypothetical protein